MTELTFQVEEYAKVGAEIRSHFARHASEVLAVDAEVDPDYGAYEEYASKGWLHIVTVRFAGFLVGYHVSVVQKHLHYKSRTVAVTDNYYLQKEVRLGYNGIKFLKFVEQSLAAKGVERLYIAATSKLDKGPLLRHLGFDEVETTYVKTIGGEHDHSIN